MRCLYLDWYKWCKSSLLKWLRLTITSMARHRTFIELLFKKIVKTRLIRESWRGDEVSQGLICLS